MLEQKRMDINNVVSDNDRIMIIELSRRVSGLLLAGKSLLFERETQIVRDQ